MSGIGHLLSAVVPAVVSIFNPVAGAVLGAGMALSGALTPKQSQPSQPQLAAPVAPVAPPVVEKPTVMPTATIDDAAVAAARRKSLADMAMRQGRASTILSDTGNEPLGGS